MEMDLVNPVLVLPFMTKINGFNMINTDINNFKKSGYVVLKNFFDKSVIEEVILDAKKTFYFQFKRLGLVKSDFEDIDPQDFDKAMVEFFNMDLGAFINCGKQVQHLISLHRISLTQEIKNILTKLGLQFPVISTRPVLFFNHKNLSKEKVYYKVEAHQDWRSMQGSLNSIVIWLPLMNITKDHGALKILPGSHLRGLISEVMEQGFGFVNLSNQDEKDLVSVEVEQGDAVVFSSFLVHQSGDNITETPRWSCHFRYNDLLEATFIERGYPHPYIYKPDSKLITENFPTEDNINQIFKL